MCRRGFHSRVFMFRTRSLQHLSPPLEILFRGGLQLRAGHCLLTLSWSISLQNCKKCFFRNKREARVLVQADASKGENCRLQLCYLMDYGISAFMKCGFSTESAPQCRIYCNIHLKWMRAHLVNLPVVCICRFVFTRAPFRSLNRKYEYYGLPVTKMHCSSSEQPYLADTSLNLSQCNLQMSWSWYFRQSSSLYCSASSPSCFSFFLILFLFSTTFDLLMPETC